MTSQPQTIIIITSRARAPVPQELQRGTERRRGERSNRSLSLQLQSTSSTTPPSEPTHLSFSKPHDQEHPNLHQQPNRPNQAQTNDRNAAPHHPPPPLNRKTQLPPYHHRHNNNNPPLLPLPPQPSPQRHPRQRLPQARTNRILQIRQRRRRSRDRESSLRPFLDTPRRRAKHRWEGEWW